MALRIDNNFGLFSGGSGGSASGVIFVGATGGVGISVTGSPITSCGTFGITNTAPYLGQAIEIVGSGTCSTLRCGVNNTSSGNYSASLGGNYNCSCGTNSVVVGGIGNNSKGNNSFIGGGCFNCVEGTLSTIGGGVCNFLKNSNVSIDVLGSVIGGGIGNNTIGGSWNGTSFTSPPSVSNTQCYTFIGGGFQNSAKTCGSTIGGGLNNIAIGVSSTILGGNLNCSVDNYTTIGGGQLNKSCGSGSIIGGGSSNTTKSTYNTIIGGCLNTTDSSDSMIGGGTSNISCNQSSFIGGGCSNIINGTSSQANVIGGGYLNNICNLATNSFIGGGSGNRLSDLNSIILGGILNTIGNTTLFPIQSTSSSLQQIYFCGNVSSSISVSNTIYYYHTTDKKVYSGVVDSVTYNSGTNLTIVSGTQLCGGTTNSTNTFGRNKNIESNGGSNYGSINGGFANSIDGGSNSIILNGEANCIDTQCQSSILNGFCNTINDFNLGAKRNNCYNTINNGTLNSINNKGDYNNITNGNSNCIIGSCVNYGYIGNGKQNKIGCCNTNYGLILNGFSNITSGNFTFIGNGICNNLYDVDTNGINSSNTFASIILNGVGNNGSNGNWNDSTKTFDSPLTLLQGSCFTIIGNGNQNQALSPYSNILNGCCNIIRNNSYFSNINNGITNLITNSNYSSITNGQNHNIIDSPYSFIANGELNEINQSNYSIIGNGYANNIFNSSFSIIASGNQNRINSSLNDVLIGGESNCIDYNGATSSYNSLVGGCLSCIMSSNGSFIGGGYSNTITSSNCSAILGGQNNTISSYNDAFVLGSNITTNRECTTFVNSLSIYDTPQVDNSASTLGIDGNGLVVRKTIGVGVSSVGLIVPPAFSVVNSPITTSGNICIVGAGLSTQYVRGDGVLATFPVVSGGGGGSVYYLNTTQDTCVSLGLKQVSRTAVFPGSTCIITNSGIVDGTPFVKFITDVNDPNLTQLPGGIWEYNAYLSVATGNTSTIRADVYKYCTNNGLFSNVGVGAPLQLVDGSTISLYTFSTAVPTTTFATNDRFAIYFVGVTTNDVVCLTTSSSRLAAVTTTISSGISSINQISTSSQFFTTTTNCNDFCITSSGCTHCFNLPTASATSRGIISTSDWNTFNNKQSTSYPANTFYVNATSSTATAQQGTYCESGEIALTSSDIKFTCIAVGTPYTFGQAYYRYTKIGNLVNLSTYVCFSANSLIGICGIEAQLPTSIPTPYIPFNSTSVGTPISVASSMFNNTITFGGGVVKAAFVISSKGSPTDYGICWILPSAQTACRVYYANVTYISSTL